MSISCAPRFINSEAGTLFGHRERIGFGTDDFHVRLIPRAVAVDVIRKNHYSRRTFPNSVIHCGAFIGSDMVGVLQFGCAMNPQSMASVVADTQYDEYLELNRMWMSDDAPRNSESRAISFALKLCRQVRPRLAWVQSFADERCGGLGVVYQACSFLYCGEHTSIFWELDGEVYHNIAMTATGDCRKGSAHLQANKDRATPMELRQFRYIKFLKQSFRKRLLLPVLPYPKREASCVG